MAGVDIFVDTISDFSRKVEAAVAAVETASKQDHEAKEQQRGRSRYSSSAPPYVPAHASSNRVSSTPLS